MNNIFLHFLQSSLAGIFAFAVLQIFKMIAKKYFCSGWYYNLLKALLLIFVLPLPNIAMSAPLGLPTVRPLMEYEAIKDTIIPQMQTASKIDLITMLCIIWFIGMCVIVLWQILCFIRFNSEIKKSVLAIEPHVLLALKRAKEKTNVTGEIKVFYSKSIQSPIFLGVFKPKIILHNNTLSEKSLEYVFLHELVHFKRRDLLLKLLMLTVQALHWFNPIIYLVKKEFTLFLENSCDECVVSELDKTARKDYGLAILDSISTKKYINLGLAFSITNGSASIERRLSNMLKFKNNMKKSKTRGAAVVAIALMVASALPVYAAESAVTETTTGIAMISQAGATLLSSEFAEETLNTAQLDGDKNLDLPSPRSSGDLGGGKAYTYDKQTLTKGQTVTINAEWTPTSVDINIGLKSAAGTVTSKKVTGGSGDVTYTINSTGEYSIYVGNNSSSNVKFDVSYIVN